jgi:hypothetical protein
LLSFLGIIVVSLVAGIFPLLLLIASRRKGDYVPRTVYRPLGHPVLLGGLYAAVAELREIADGRGDLLAERAG